MPRFLQQLSYIQMPIVAKLSNSIGYEYIDYSILLQTTVQSPTDWEKHCHFLKQMLDRHKEIIFGTGKLIKQKRETCSLVNQIMAKKTITKPWQSNIDHVKFQTTFSFQILHYGKMCMPLSPIVNKSVNVHSDVHIWAEILGMKFWRDPRGKKKILEGFDISIQNRQKPKTTPYP